LGEITLAVGTTKFELRRKENNVTKFVLGPPLENTYNHVTLTGKNANHPTCGENQTTDENA